MRRILAIALTLASASALADIYRWIDPATGKVMVSDTPPPGNAHHVTQDTGQPAPKGQSYALRRAVENYPVTLYTSADCGAECKSARDLLSGRGVPYTEKVVQGPADADELKALVGDVFVPSLKVGRQSQRGFQADAFNRILDLAGYPSAAQ